MWLPDPNDGSGTGAFVRVWHHLSFLRFVALKCLFVCVQSLVYASSGRLGVSEMFLGVVCFDVSGKIKYWLVIFLYKPAFVVWLIFIAFVRMKSCLELLKCFVVSFHFFFYINGAQ